MYDHLEIFVETYFIEFIGQEVGNYHIYAWWLIYLQSVDIIWRSLVAVWLLI